MTGDPRVPARDFRVIWASELPTHQLHIVVAAGIVGDVVHGHRRFNRFRDAAALRELDVGRSRAAGNTLRSSAAGSVCKLGPGLRKGGAN